MANVPPPLFSSGVPMSSSTAAAVASRGHLPATLNLDDIFGDVAFTPDGETVFLSEETKAEDEEAGGLLNSGEGENVASVASRPNADGTFSAVPQAGGLYTTNLYDASKPSLSMGAAVEGVKKTEVVPFKHAPQASHHLQYAAPKKKKSSSRADRKMNDQQKNERRYALCKVICAIE
jgi:hypothetical protein